MDTCTETTNEHFVDLDQCLNLINDLHKTLTVEKNAAVHGEGQTSCTESERLVDTFKKTVDKYQEQPDLIEPYLAQLIENLTGHLGDSNQESRELYHTSFKFLYQLIKVVGFKSFGRKLPHETSKLPMLISLLEKEDPSDKLNWQTRYVLVVWLSTVILAPFDLAKFDSDPSAPAISDRIYSTLVRSLDNHDSCQHVTAYCLAKLLTRADMMRDARNLNNSIESTMNEMANVKVSASSTDDIKLIGHLRTLCYIFKFANRNELRAHGERILAGIMASDIGAINRELVRHLYTKLLQRIGISFLPARVATWRYKRGSRILAATTTTSSEASNPPSEHVAHNDDDASNLSGEEETPTCTEALQSILGVLIVEGKSAQTRIRWSAAKGLARIASRLSRARASDVIDTVLQVYFDKDMTNEYAWHGGCLTLAEMARQGLILEEKLPEVIDLVSRAILYDKIKGSCAIGAQVREAACYVFWAMSRTYEDHLLASHITSISINLLCTTLFDRELQCRRAASATFQELVGRQGTFSAEGISILTHLDYQSVGLRQFAYLELATQVAGLGSKYHEPFIRHLIGRKIGHWDIKIRRLASDSLAALMLYPGDEGDFIESAVLGPLAEMCRQPLDNNAKHGAILALAKVIRGLVPKGYQFQAELVELVGSMVSVCAKQLKSKQQAPNFIEAIASLIVSSERAKFTFSEETSEQQWEPLILQALDSDNADLRNIASDSLLTLYRYFYKQNKSARDRLLTILNRSLSSPNENTRCGCLQSLAKLAQAMSDSLFVTGSHVDEKQEPGREGPPSEGELQPTGFKQTENSGRCEIKVDSDTPDIILMSLTSYIGKETREKSTEFVFAQAKAEACQALASFIKALDESRLVTSRQWLQVGYDVLLQKSEDYTFDKRGDIGVVVRKGAIGALQELTLFLMSIGMSSVLEEKLDEELDEMTDDGASAQGRRRAPAYGNRMTKIMAKILQQCVSYNNSAREQAALAFYRLMRALNENQLNDTIPSQALILELFERHGVHGQAGESQQDGEAFNWRDESGPLFASLLVEPVYNLDLWLGFVPALGMASDLCTRDSQLVLVHDIRRMIANRSQFNMGAVFDGLFVCLDSNKRLSVNALKVVDCLVTRSQLDELDDELLVRLVESCWRLRGLATDAKRQMLISRVMCSMLHFSGQALVECLKHCLDLLLGPCLDVRVHTAEQMGCVISCGGIEGKLLELAQRGRQT